MSSATIVALIAVGIVTMIIVAFTAQTLENNRQERHRRVLVLQDHARQLWNALNDIPASYLIPEIRQFLLAELKRCYREVLTLEPRNEGAKGQLKNIDSHSQQAYERQIDTLTPVFTDHVSGQKIRTEIKTLVNHVVKLHGDGLLEKNLAQQQINLGKALYALVSIDLNLLTARTMEQSDNPKSALIHYSGSLKQLEKVHPYLQLSNRIKFVSNKVDALKALAAEPAATGGGAEDDKEWQKFAGTDETDWKIKQEYE